MATRVTKNADLLAERQKCTFAIEELTNFLDNGAERTASRRKIENFFFNDPELQDAVPVDYLSHKEKYEEHIRKACVVFRKVKELQDQGEGGVEIFMHLVGSSIGTAVTKEGNPFALHYVMFIPTLMGQGTLEQQAEWITKAWTCSILGTYAQTEMGHGTFLRGLETTAHYDKQTEEFVINSPTLTSYKWWPGGLGQTANYAVVVAKMFIDDKPHGIHPFIVQLRDVDTHHPMPGIRIGEIGTKLGMNGVNNGYLGFENVRIPRKHMLMKNNKVLKDGTFIQSPNTKLTYGTMIFVRVALLNDMSVYLSKAVTIATRYSAVRKQGGLKGDGTEETQIMDYMTQQHKLFPNIASVFAFKLCAMWLWDIYNMVTSEIEQGDMDRLPELHAISCCLKAVSTFEASRGVEQCRMACGGHGYMTCSAFPLLYGYATAACTYEGENTVLFLQTSRFLMKAWHQAKMGDTLTETVQYLKLAVDGKHYTFGTDVASLLDALKMVAARKIQLCYDDIERRTNNGATPEDAWNDTSMFLVQAAEAHCRVFLVEKYQAILQARMQNLSKPLQVVMIDLLELYTIETCFKMLGDLLRFVKLTEANLQALQQRLVTLLKRIRPNAVGLVDAFDFPDESLNSVLGAYDGDVYQRLFNEAQKSPLNREPVNRSFELYLKPFLKSSV